ncbi:hypothetical protein EJ03DRAFT_135772 [Teratosphaeria nubilosa]|uniref:Uncharacterized protein n=1 Tax=Teratosphaeria nubilosa TaxID=161662 RepID=A0A6G1L548_9PEZI|nr:hypothetical protein EJ03DRAFT_135772 [Teratosphaeria nubilosa]
MRYITTYHDIPLCAQSSSENHCAIAKNAPKVVRQEHSPSPSPFSNPNVAAQTPPHAQSAAERESVSASSRDQAKDTQAAAVPRLPAPSPYPAPWRTKPYELRPADVPVPQPRELQVVDDKTCSRPQYHHRRQQQQQQQQHLMTTVEPARRLDYRQRLR